MRCSVPPRYAHCRDLVDERVERGTTAPDAEAGPPSDVIERDRTVTRDVALDQRRCRLRRVEAAQPHLWQCLGEAAVRVAGVAPSGYGLVTQEPALVAHLVEYDRQWNFAADVGGWHWRTALFARPTPSALATPSPDPREAAPLVHADEHSVYLRPRGAPVSRACHRV